MERLGQLKPGWGILPVAIFLAIWEMVARLDLIPGHFFFPSFSTVMQEFYRLVANGVLPSNFLSSLVRVLIGFCAGSLAGLLVGTLMGCIRNVDKNFVQAARTLGASDLRVLLTIVFPLALPTIFTGLRLEAGMAWRVIIAAEMVAIPTGIGALMMRAESLMRVDIIIVCLMVLATMCFLFERIFTYLEKRLTEGWR